MLNNGNDGESKTDKKVDKYAKKVSKQSRKVARAVRKEKRGGNKKMTVTAPDDSSATTKFDRKGNTKKIVYRNESGKKTGVDRFTKLERQKEGQTRSGKYAEEDKPITYKNKKKKATPKKKVSRGLAEVREEDPYSKTMKEKK